MAHGAPAPPEQLAEHREQVRRRLKEAMVARDAQDVELLRAALETACEVDPAMEDIAPARRLLERIELEMQPLTFTDVSSNDMECLQAARTRDEVLQVLMRCMRLSLDHGFQAEILAEFHYHNFTFCQQSGFSTAATSTLLSIMRATHTQAIVQEKWRRPRAEDFFEELIRRHSMPLPPYCYGALTEAEALAARAFASRGFFRHFDMYAFAYTGRQELRLSSLDDLVVLKVPEITRLHKAFEVDPRDVAELRELFLEPEDGAASNGFATPDAAGVRSVARGVSVGSLASAGVGRHRGASGGGRQAEIEAAIDEALTGHLGGLTARLENHPLAG